MANMTFKKYPSYDHYVAEQREKMLVLGESWLQKYDKEYSSLLSLRLVGWELSGKSVLCLGARIGTEVKAFQDHGAFAVGIDLEPGKQNPYVLTGDFHSIQFPKNSVDFVFTNALDHAYDLRKVIEEVYRVLKMHGIFIIEAVAGSEEGVKPGKYESVIWPKIEDLKGFFAVGFGLLSEMNIEKPWKGKHINYQKRAL